MIHHFDFAVITFLHQLAHSWLFDYFVFCLSGNNLLKGGLFVTAFWWFWFRRSESQTRDRIIIVSTLFACLLAIGGNQALKVSAAFRLRPYLGIQGLSFPFDLGIAKSSSFPSDHATLFFAFSTGLFYLSRRVGIAALVYSIVMICLPRIYLGLHYPSDILAGAVVGVVIAWLVNGTHLRDRIGNPLLKLAEKHPAFFHGCFFLLSYQIATLFDDLRDLGNCLRVVFNSFGH